jgi:hypothetical protein
MVGGYMSEYVKMFKIICDTIERIYGLHEEIEGRKLSDLSIRELLPLISKTLATEHPRVIGDRNLSVWPHTGLIAHFHLRLKFFNKTELKFNNFPQIKELIEVLSIFESSKNITVESRTKANVIASILNSIDTKFLQLRFDDNLEYRFLRIILLMIMYNNHAEASVVVRFILGQLKGVA